MTGEHQTAGHYDARYHAELRAGAGSSAQRVIPRILELVKPASIVDFGCGSAGWLAAAGHHGVNDMLGVDGPWVAASTLEIAPERFVAADLAAPLELGRRFDLALCLEVIEHLPPEAGAVLIATLTTHAPIVLFSAAVPGQGGEGHVNEAWPSVWRDLFAQRGFACLDILRGKFWNETAIEPWYRQNLLVFASQDLLERDDELASRLSQPVAPPLDIGHPEILAEETAKKRVVEAERDRLQKLTDDLLERVEELGLAFEDQRIELEHLRSAGALKWLSALLRVYSSRARKSE